MNLILVSTGHYPYKHAGGIRQATLARGLADSGHSVNFLMLTPQHWTEDTLDDFGVTYTALNKYRGNNKFLKYYHELIAIYKAKKLITAQAKQKKLDAVVIYTIEIGPIYILTKAAQALGVKVYHERTELPYALGTQSKKQQTILRYYLKLLPKFDGIFVISNKLIEYIGQFNRNLQKLVTVVELAHFKSGGASSYPFPYIGYCGTISGNKDGVPVLIESFATIHKKYPTLKLVLAGNDKDKNAIRETLDAIDRFGIKDKVVFAGFVERPNMPAFLGNAEILVVSKPDNEQNSGNFPIKIGEYLTTGVPVVLTSVGEIPVFVKDGESGFLAAPGSSESFAKKMDEALSDKERAKKVGQAGRKVAEDNFDYVKVAAIMAGFIENTNKKG